MIGLIIFIIGAIILTTAFLISNPNNHRPNKTKWSITLGIIGALLMFGIAFFQIFSIRWKEIYKDSENTTIHSLQTEETRQGYYVIGLSEQDGKAYYNFLVERNDTLSMEKVETGIGFEVNITTEEAFLEERTETYELRRDLTRWQRNLVSPPFNNKLTFTHTYLHVPKNTILKEID